MASEASRESPDLDPLARAIAEARAREFGLSVSDYLSRLILMPFHGDVGAENLHMGSPATSALREDWREFDPWQSTLDTIASGRSDRPILRRTAAADWSNLAASPPPWTTTSVSPTLHLIAVFNDRIQGAALLMSAAFLEAAVSDFRAPSMRREPNRRRPSSSTWYEQVISTCLIRSREVRNALLHPWQPTVRAERLAIEAFVLLTDLTPARTELLRLCRYDRPRAFSELAKHLDLVTDQFSLSAHLLAEVEAGEQSSALAGERFADASAALLERAGGGVSLTEGAQLLGTTRQALHKRIKAGSALAMMQGTELVLPRIQFVTAGSKTRLIESLSQVVRLFDEAQAGGWSALQFLIEHDANLGDAPIRILSKGRVDAVVNAARAYLRCDEE